MLSGSEQGVLHLGGDWLGTQDAMMTPGSAEARSEPKLPCSNRRKSSGLRSPYPASAHSACGVYVLLWPSTGKDDSGWEHERVLRKPVPSACTSLSWSRFP